MFLVGAILFGQKVETMRIEIDERIAHDQGAAIIGVIKRKFACGGAIDLYGLQGSELRPSDNVWLLGNCVLSSAGKKTRTECGCAKDTAARA